MMDNSEQIASLLVGVGFDYPKHGYGIITHVSEQHIEAEFESGSRIFLRDRFAQLAKFAEPEPLQLLSIQLALLHNLFVPAHKAELVSSVHKFLHNNEALEPSPSEVGSDFSLLAPEERPESIRPVINAGTITNVSGDGPMQLEYVLLYMMNGYAVFDCYEGEDYEFEADSGLAYGLSDVVRIFDEEIDCYICFMEEYDRLFDQAHLPDDGTYLGMRITRNITSVADLETSVKLLLMFENVCNPFIGQFATQPEEEEEEEDDDDDDDEDEDVEPDERPLTYQDFVVVANRRTCISNNHEMQKLRAFVSVLFPGGEIVNVWIPAYYCDACKQYYMHDYDYHRAKGENGVFLCRVVYEKSYAKEFTEGYKELADESIFFQCGYNVNKVNKLSEVQRRTILDQIIGQKVRTLFKAESHISWLIKGGRRNRLLADAVKKWESDLEYLKTEYHRDGTKVGIATIRTKI